MTDPIKFNPVKAVAEARVEASAKIELGHAVLNAVGMRGARGGGRMEWRGMHTTYYTTDNKDK